MSKKIFFILALGLLSGCMDASLMKLPSLDKVTDTSPPEGPVENLVRKEPDFISGELVTTGSGYQIKGAFGEISEKKTLANGYTIEGVFYE